MELNWKTTLRIPNKLKKNKCAFRNECPEALIKDKWHTSVSSRTDETGKLTFRGFYGVYRGTATTGGQKFAFELTHSPDHKGDYVIRLN